MMNKRFMLGLVVVAMAISGAVAAADDSVYVDLSVLESLGTASPAVNNHASEPLFPIVKKSPKVKKPAPRKAPSKVKVEVKDARPVIKVEVKKLPAPAPANEKEPVAASVPVVEDTPAGADKVVVSQQIPYIEDVEPVVVVDVEPVSAAQTPPAPQASAATTSEPSIPATAAPLANMAEIESVPSPAAPTLLVDEQVQEPKTVTLGKLTFEETSDELTPAHQAQIDAAVASFQDPMKNKIAIYSYNLDDGVDTFKKKRLSLNRAVEVRSYLLPKGYKNFSIKVINIDAASDKANTVEMVELR